MKTTVEISDSLLREAKLVARKRDKTLRQLIEEGLKEVLRKSNTQQAFKLKDGSVSGDGLKDEFINATWSEIRALAYGERE